MLENLEKTLTNAVNNFENNNIEISQEKRDIQNKISILFNSSELDNYYKSTLYLDEVRTMLLELTDIRNKVKKTFENSNELILRLCKNDFINQLLTAYFFKQKVLKDNQEFFITWSILNSKNNDTLYPLINFFDFIINLFESNLKQKTKEFNIEFYSLDDKQIYFKLNKNTSQLNKINSCFEVEKRDIKEVDQTLIYASLNKDLFYKIFVQLLSKEKYFSTNGIILNKSNDLKSSYITMFNSINIYSHNLDIEIDKNYIISQDNINFELFSNTFKTLKKDDFIELAIKENIMYLKRQSDQTIKEIKLTEFNFNQNNNDVNIDINNHDRKFLTFNNLIQENNLTDKSNYLFRFDNLEQLKEVHRKLNIFDNTYKNEYKTTYNHSVNLNIKKRFFDLTVKTIEKIAYEVKDGTKQVNEQIAVKNKKGKITDWLDNFKEVDNMITKYNIKEIDENLLNVFSSKLSKDYSININLYLDKFIQILELMVKNEFLEIKLSQSQKELILHDNTNFIIMSYKDKKD